MRSLILNLGGHSVTGGIERYVVDVHRGLSNAVGETASVSLWDHPKDVPLFDPGHYVACERSKLGFIRKVTSELQRHRPDIVWLGHVMLLPAIPLIRLLRPRARIGVLTYGFEVWDPMSRLSRALMRRADVVVCITETSRSRLIEAQGVDPDRTQILAPMLCPAMFAEASDQPVERPPHRGLRVLSVSRLGEDVEEKGIPTAVRAFRRARPDLPDATFTIIGDGTGRGAVERATGGDVENIEMLGRVSDERLREAYRTADVFLMPSRIEGFGIVYAEAMSWGLPCIAGNRDAAKDVVVDGETGLLVDPEDEAAIAEALIALDADPARRLRFGRAGRARVRAHYSREHFERRLEEIARHAAPIAPRVRAGR